MDLQTEIRCLQCGLKMDYNKKEETYECIVCLQAYTLQGNMKHGVNKR